MADEEKGTASDDASSQGTAKKKLHDYDDVSSKLIDQVKKGVIGEAQDFSFLAQATIGELVYATVVIGALMVQTVNAVASGVATIHAKEVAEQYRLVLNKLAETIDIEMCDLFVALAKNKGV